MPNSALNVEAKRNQKGNLAMKNNHQRITLAALIAGLALTAIFFVMSKNALLVIAYIFALFAVLSLAAAAIYLARCSAKNYIVRIPFVRFALRYAVSELLLSIVCLLAFYAGYALPSAVFCLLHLLLLTFFVWKLLALDAGRSHIEAVAATVELKTSAWKGYVSRLQELKAQATGKNAELASAKEFLALLDAARYADPASNETVIGLEKEIFAKTTSIEEAIEKDDSEALAASASGLQQLILQRNDILKTAK